MERRKRLATATSVVQASSYSVLRTMSLAMRERDDLERAEFRTPPSID